MDGIQYVAQTCWCVGAIAEFTSHDKYSREGTPLKWIFVLCFFVLFCAQSTFNTGMACVGTLVNDLFQTCNYTRLSSTVEHIFSLNDLDLQ